MEYLDLATGKVNLLLPKIPSGFGLTLSPDGGSLLYSQLATVGADLVLVENFR